MPDPNGHDAPGIEMPNGAPPDAKPADPLDNAIARLEIVAPISIVVPTYREVENIPLLIARIAQLRADQGLTLELIFVDDQSRDGSAEAAAAAEHDWVRFIERDGPRGLSPAVIDGFRAAKYPLLVCMDCDLSHPEDRIPQMILSLATGHEMALGSRYVTGGSTDDDWGFFRWLNSRVATLIARPLTRVKDPMSGFFALRKYNFDNADALNPVGYKIALELIVKCGFEHVGEVPIHFSDRQHGQSKLSLREQLKYIKHARRLYLHKFANAMYLAQFLVVGASGVVVNLAVLTLLSLAGAAEWLALLGGIAVSLVTNFLLNRRFSFSYAREGNPWKQFGGFVAASMIGLAVNYTVSISLATSGLIKGDYALQLSALVGIACGLVFNFLGNRFVVFRRTHIR